MDYRQISVKLLTAFNESHYSYSQLAQITGIPKSALQRYISGDTGKIPLDRLKLICEKLDLDTAGVLGWDDEHQAGTEESANAHGHAHPPKTLEARIVSYGMDSLPKEEREKILSILQTMYNNNPGLFKEDSQDADA